MVLACGAGNGRIAGVMTFLPVVERELRVAARKHGTYWGRMLAAVAGVGVAAWSLVASGGGTQVGAVVFETLSAIIFIYCAVSGVLFTSDCISEEKREGTLGLLFLTDLKGCANSRLLVWFRRVVADGKPPTLREAAIEEEMTQAALEAKCN